MTRSTQFDDMSLEEIAAFIKERKEEIRQAALIKNYKIEEMHKAEAIKQMQILADRNGRSLEEEAQSHLNELTRDGDPGRWIQACYVLGLERPKF